MIDEGSRPVSLVSEAVLDAPLDKLFGSYEQAEDRRHVYCVFMRGHISETLARSMYHP